MPTDPADAPFKKRGKARMRRYRTPKIGVKPITFFIPNILTLCGMCCGLTGIHMALVEKWSLAIVVILLAGFFDGIDGRVARKLGASSRFGAELDSLSDSATFGIAPAVIIYLDTLYRMGRFGWAIAVLFAVCMALRLARFNTCSIEGTSAPWMEGFATGVPAPAGAYLLLMPIMIEQWLHISIYVWISAAWTVLVAGLLISRLPTFLLKTKKRMISPHHIASMLMVIAIFLGIAYSFTWPTMIGIGVAYAFLIPVSMRIVRARKKVYESEQAQ